MMSSGTVSWLKNKAKGKADHDEDGVLKMTPATVKYLCMDHDGYDCEEINDKLYLHFQGFKEIGGLEAYTGLKCLFLESNAITQVSGLSHLSSLRSLYLQQNVIKQLRSPAFKGLSNLVTLDISQNLVQSLEGIEELVSLRTLNASKNYLAEAQSLASLHQLTNLTSVDLKSNKLESEDVLDSVIELAHITALYLSGNPVVRNTKHYRKRLIAKLPQLTYLDERPVDEKEIVLAQAWASGGQDAEAAAREAWLKQDREKIAAKHHSWTLFKQEVELKRQSEIDEAAAQGKPPPAPKRFVSYQSNVIESEEKQLQALIGEPSPAALRCSDGTEANDPTGQAKELSGTASKCNSKKEGETAECNSEPSKDSKVVLKDACPSNELGTGAETGPQDAVKSAESVQVHKTSSPSAAAQHDKRVDESFRIYTERKRLAALKKEKAQEKQEKHNQAESAEKNNVKMKVFTDATKIDLESFKALKSPKVNETSSGQNHTEPSLNAGVEPPLAPLNIIQDAVVEFKYDFTKASAHIKKITGIEVSPEVCRQQFVKARRSKASQKSGTKCVPVDSGNANTGIHKGEALLASGQELVQSTRVEEQVMGRPMPKVGVKPPTCLPSIVDLESDDCGSLSPTSERGLVDVSNSVGPECDESDNDSPNVFNKRLTRQRILESLHGSNNHPLAVDDTNLDELL